MPSKFLKFNANYTWYESFVSFKLKIDCFLVIFIFRGIVKFYIFYLKKFKLKMLLNPLIEINKKSTNYIVLLFWIKPIKNRFGSAVAIWWRKENGCGWPATIQSTTLTGPMENQAMNLEENIAWACYSIPTITGMMNDALPFFHSFVKKRRKYVNLTSVSSKLLHAGSLIKTGKSIHCWWSI